jgi:peptide/nickel transport system permease protein
MARAIVVRLVQAVPALVGVTLVVFLLLHASGDPAQVLLPQGASPAELEAFRAAYGLDQPLPVQYGRFLLNAAHGDLGTSFAYHEPTLSVLLRRLPATVDLALAAVVLAAVVALPAGILAALHRNSPLDQAVMLASALGQSVASFWLGLMLILLFAVQWGLLPASGTGSPAHLVLPAFTLSTFLIALLARLVRSAMLEVLGRDYLRTARAKGLSERAVVLRHALRNALIPIVTVVGVSLSNLMGGAVITETVFAWPGIGTLMYDSVIRRDYPMVLTVVFFVAVVFVVVNLLVDLLYTVIDPRIRLGGEGGT